MKLCLLKSVLDNTSRHMIGKVDVHTSSVMSVQHCLRLETISIHVPLCPPGV